MAKETYKNALTGAFNQFITPTPTEHPQKNETTAAITEQRQKGKNRISPEEMEKRKERAKHNAQYISTAPAMYKAATDTSNPRGRRVQLLFRPNTHAELLAIAHAQGRSLNNLIENILTDYINRERNR